MKPKTALLSKTEVMRIAVPASVMKINSFLLAALGQIAAAANRPVEFHFFPLGARGFVNAWNQQGPAHHCAVGVGHIAATLAKAASLMGLGFHQVC